MNKTRTVGFPVDTLGYRGPLASRPCPFRAGTGIVYPRTVSPSIEIGRQRIGRGHPYFVIADVGVNHNGDVQLAHRLIDLAAATRAEAVKFQTYMPELLAP